MSNNTRTKWKEAEWKMVCAELMRRYPIQMASSTLIGIMADDVFVAMRNVLPENRWRASMNMTHVRPKLREQYLIIKTEMDMAARMAEEERSKAEADKRRAEEQARNAQADVFAPLMKLLAEHLFKQLQPMIDHYVATRIGQPNGNEAVISHHREKSQRVRKPKVGVIGLLPIQANDLEKEFPNLEFIFVEKGQNGQEVKNKFGSVDVVFGLTPKMAHAAESALKAMPQVWGNYHRVSGKGWSAVRRSVQLWLNETRRQVD